MKGNKMTSKFNGSQTNSILLRVEGGIGFRISSQAVVGAILVLLGDMGYDVALRGPSNRLLVLDRPIAYSAIRPLIERAEEMTVQPLVSELGYGSVDGLMNALLTGKA